MTRLYNVYVMSELFVFKNPIFSLTESLEKVECCCQQKRTFWRSAPTIVWRLGFAIAGFREGCGAPGGEKNGRKTKE